MRDGMNRITRSTLPEGSYFLDPTLHVGCPSVNIHQLNARNHLAMVEIGTGINKQTVWQYDNLNRLIQEQATNNSTAPAMIASY